MKINSEKFFSFFSKATLNGSIKTALIKIENKQLHVWIKSNDNTVAVNATLKNVEADNQVWPIKDTQIFLNSLKLFQGQIELLQNDNKLSMFNADRQVDFVLAAESFIENNLNKYPGVEYDKIVTIPSSIFKNSLKNKNVLNVNDINLISDGKLLTITTGDSKFDTITEKLVVDLPVANVSLGEVANNIFSNLDDKIDFGIKTDYPVLFKMETGEYIIQYVVANVVNDGE